MPIPTGPVRGLETRVAAIEEHLGISEDPAQDFVDRTPLGAPAIIRDEEDVEKVDEFVDHDDAMRLVDGDPDPDNEDANDPFDAAVNPDAMPAVNAPDEIFDGEGPARGADGRFVSADENDDDPDA